MSHTQHGHLHQAQKYFCVKLEDGIDLDNRHRQLSSSDLQLLVCRLHGNQLNRDIPTFLHSRIRKCQYLLLDWYLVLPKLIQHVHRKVTQLNRCTRSQVDQSVLLHKLQLIRPENCMSMHDKGKHDVSRIQFPLELPLLLYVCKSLEMLL